METLLCSVAALSQLSSVTVHVCLDRGGRLDGGRGGGGGGGGDGVGVVVG